MKQHIQELYELGLEKFAGDAEAASDFVRGFMKEAMFGPLNEPLLKGLGTAAGSAVAGMGIGLGIHGISSMMNQAGNKNLHAAFTSALAKVTGSNPILQDADSARVQSYADTVFKFAPHVACDPNLLSSVLANAVHGEGIDPMTIRTLTDLEAKLMESRKNSLFSPKSYL